ncbi:hypothetical protein DITRI_Ditri03aG0195100 [Diplodiscus trichospermus]
MVFFFSRIDEKKAPATSKAEYDEIMNLFNHCDVNNDGKLSWKEVKAGFRRLQSRFPGFRTQRAFQIADQNRDGCIDKEELEKLVTYALGCYEGDVKLRLI